MAKKKAATEKKRSKLDILNELTGSINADYENSRVIGLDEQPEIVPCIPSDLPSVDLRAMRIGGIGKGVVVEMYGPTGGGKTTLALQFIAACQRRGGTVGFVDAEQALNKSLAVSVGCDLSKEKFVFAQPGSGEEALGITRKMIKSGVVDLIVFDSLAAIVPTKSLGKNPEDTEVIGERARLVSKEYPKIVSEAAAAPNQPIVIFVNQLRWKINKMGPSTLEPTCGHAPKFYSSMRVNVKNIRKLKEGGKEDGQIIGHRIKIDVIKNKFAPPFYSTELNLIYGQGFDLYAELIDVGAGAGLIVQSGAWFDGAKYGLPKVQGAPKLREALANNEEAFLGLRKDVIAFLKEEVKNSAPEKIDVPFERGVDDYDKEMKSGW